MKKGVRITLQTLLYISSHSLLLLSDLFPNKILGGIIITIIYVVSTYFLWNKTKRETILTSIVIFTIIEFLIINGQDGLGFEERTKMYFGNLVSCVLPVTMITTLIFLLIKNLITRNKISSEENSVKKN